MLSRELKEEAYKFALKNALDYGKAAVEPVMNKLLAISPDLKKDIAGLRQEVSKVVDEVNALSRQELEKRFEPYAEEFEEKEQKKKEQTSKPAMVLEGAVDGDFAARYPPEPNGYMHIGNAKQAFLSQEFAKIYHGKLFLYFDDTNPEKDRQEYVDAIIQDTAWLGLKFDNVYYASDMVDKIYDYARKLIKDGNAYVCFCSKEEINRNRATKTACKHREQSPEENLEYFEEMIKGKYKEGEAVVRFKGDMSSENPVMRDPSLLRIKETPHYRQGTKYRVWPTYYFNTPINDSLHGVTDVIRSKEYELSDELYRQLLALLGLRIPRIHSISRLRIIGTSTHKRELRELIKNGIVSGYDDPRLVTIAALRRRGILPEAIRRFVLKFGMSKTDSVVSIDMLLAENRKLVDAHAKRLFFVKDPIYLHVKGLGKRRVKLRLHPTSDLGYREYEVEEDFYISKEDASKLGQGSTVCLKDLACVKIISVNKDIIEASSIEPTGEEMEKMQKIQWISDGNYAKCTIKQIGPLIVEGKVNPDSIVSVQGVVESYAKSLSEGEVVNFERVGFYKLDDKQNMVFLSL